MFGLEKKRVCEYDLEKDLLDEKARKNLVNSVEKKINSLKKELIKMNDKKKEDELAFILLGYASFLKVANTLN